MQVSKVILAIVFALAAVKTEAISLSSISTMPASFADLVEQHSKSVVNISTETKPKKLDNRQMPRNPFGGSPFEKFFEDFMGGQGFPQAQNQPRESLGSGVIISADGYVVTNAHVVKGADIITVRIGEDDEHRAKLIGSDTKNDVALLKIEGKDFPFATFGDSDKVRVGDWAIAIGNPFGLGGSVSAGIISALGRNIQQGPYDHFLQTDAAINPGNSGGPLFNTKGEVVGINTAILSRSGGSQGIGFSIPANTVMKIVNQLKEHGRPIRGWLGVRIQRVTDELAEAFGLDKGRGALVAEVTEDSPAEKAKIERGDIILSYNGEMIKEMSDLPRLVAETKIGEKVNVVVMRSGDKKDIAVTIDEMTEEEQALEDESMDEEKDHGFGLTLRTLTSEVRKEFDLAKDVEGVLIVGVAARSESARAGLRPGDIILQVNQKYVATVRDVQRYLAEDKTNLLLIQRKDGNSFVALKKHEDE